MKTQDAVAPVSKLKSNKLNLKDIDFTQLF